MSRPKFSLAERPSHLDISLVITSSDADSFGKPPYIALETQIENANLIQLG
jgi:hypothetical protein